MTTTTLPLGFLAKYREFDRIAEPAPAIFLVHMYDVKDVYEYMKTNEVPAVKLSVCLEDNSILLTDGNHRVSAAGLHEFDSLKVDITFYASREELNEVFYPHTIKRFKKASAIEMAYILNFNN